MSQQTADETGRSKRVLIVEDHQMLAEALALSLGARGFECHVAEALARESVIAQAARQRPGLVLLDLDLGDTDGLDLVPGLGARGARVLVVTGYTDEARLAQAVALGVTGWVSKTEPFERLLDAAEVAMTGRRRFPGDNLGRLGDLGRSRMAEQRELRRRLSELTSREHEVLAALSEGRKADEIAEQFYISVGTVRSHIHSILTKLGVSSQLAAVALVRPLAGQRRWHPAAGGHPARPGHEVRAQATRHMAV
jgi:DNA-binding NarL/FixJ family response regulator